MLKRIDPSTDPCGTPRKIRLQMSQREHNVYDCFILVIKSSCGKQTKVLFRSINIAPTLPKVLRQDCHLWSISSKEYLENLLFMKGTICLAISLSNTLDIEGKKLIGLLLFLSARIDGCLEYFKVTAKIGSEFITLKIGILEISIVSVILL